MDQSSVMLRVNKQTNCTLKKTSFGFAPGLCSPWLSYTYHQINQPHHSLLNFSFPHHILILMRKDSVINPVLQMGTSGTEVKCHAEGCLNQSWGWMPTLPLKGSTLPAMLPFSWSCDSITFLFISFPLVSLWKKTHSTVISWLHKGAKTFS